MSESECEDSEMVDTHLSCIKVVVIREQVLRERVSCHTTKDSLQ